LKLLVITHFTFALGDVSVLLPTAVLVMTSSAGNKLSIMPEHRVRAGIIENIIRHATVEWAQ